MEELIHAAQGDLDSVVAQVGATLHDILDRQREAVAWKLASMKPAFEREVLPGLVEQRQRWQPSAAPVYVRERRFG